MHHTELLNKLIARFGFTSYLEIGVQDGKNFRAINCPVKVGVDPDPKSAATHKMTSDEFFDHVNPSYDLIFIDGLHEEEQVKNDIIRSHHILNYNGIIVVHDVNPSTELMQRVPRETKEWTGDVWKAWVQRRAFEIGLLEMFVVDTDYGVGIIRADQKHTSFTTDLPLTYPNLAANRKEWLNLISVEEFEQWLKQG